MPLLQRIQRIEPVVFNRCCAVVALLFLLVTISGKMLWRFQTGFTPQDFPQYYMAGVVADSGAWDALYPIPKPGSPRNPGFVEDSDTKPRYQELARERGVGEGVRYMQPPPFALLTMPLGLLSFRTAFIFWNLLNCLLAWGIAMQAGTIFRCCHGKVTRASGWIILLIAFSPETHRWVRVQNISPLIGWLAGFATLQLLQTRYPLKNFQSALAVCVMGFAKYVGIVFVPLYLAMRRWQTLAWLVGIAAIWLAISVAISGRGVYDEFIHVILPTLSRSNTLAGDQSLQGFGLRVIHLEILPQSIRRTLMAAQALVFIILMILLFTRRANFWQQPVHVFAAAAALVLWMMIFSPISWDHYTAYVAPFWGWMIWEATRGPVRRVVVIVAIASEYASMALFHLTAHAPEPIASHMLWGSCAMLGLAVWRLMNPLDRAGGETVE